MKFGVREICDVVLKAKTTQKIGNKVFYKHEPVIYFDTLKTSTLEGAATTVYAQGGRGNPRLIAWEGERTITFTMEDALISPEGFAILSGAGIIEASSDKPIYQHTTEISSKITSGISTTYKYNDEGKKYEPIDNKYVDVFIQNTPAFISNQTEDHLYLMAMKNGNIISEPFLAPTYVDGLAQPYSNYVLASDLNNQVFYDKEVKKYYSVTGQTTSLPFDENWLEESIPVNTITAKSNDVTINLVDEDETEIQLVYKYTSAVGETKASSKWTIGSETISSSSTLNLSAINLSEGETADGKVTLPIKITSRSGEFDITRSNYTNNFMANTIVWGDREVSPSDLLYRLRVNSEKLISSTGGTTYITREYKATDLATLVSADAVLVDYYVERTSKAKQIEIAADKFGGNFYLEASTLFRNEAGVDMPAEFVIPNCKIQSNFNFSMASSGDPSTFTFTMDAFPDYTRFDSKKKVLFALQIIESGADDELKECGNTRTSTAATISSDAAAEVNEPAAASLEEEVEPVGYEEDTDLLEDYLTDEEI